MNDWEEIRTGDLLSEQQDCLSGNTTGCTNNPLFFI